MPTYQYACTECGHEFETVQSFTDPALSECPECAGRLRKVYGAVGVVFKGSGFYRNDSRAAAKTGSKANGATPKSETADGTKETTAPTASESSSGSTSTSGSGDKAASSSGNGSGTSSSTTKSSTPAAAKS